MLDDYQSAQVYLEGFDACRAGLNETRDNPYPLQTEKSALWLDGYFTELMGCEYSEIWLWEGD